MMYNQACGIKVLEICNRTGGFCNEDQDCQKYKEFSFTLNQEICPHQEQREIRMPKRDKGVF
jgi:hypothetical protein